jgi:hypothetical protein
MSWVAVGTIAVAAVSSAMSASEGNKANSKNYLNALQDNIATNQAIEESNMVNQIRTGFQVGILNVQRGQRRSQAAGQKYKISQAAMEALGGAAANTAASGAVGSSADAVSIDIRKRSAEAVIESQANWEIAQFNFDVQLNDIIQSGMDSLQSGVRPGEQPELKSVGGAAFMGGLSAAASMGSSYMGAKMNLGLGSPAQAGATQSTSTWSTSGGAGVDWGTR